MSDENECKVDSVTIRYDLDETVFSHSSVDERLLTRWTGADDKEAAGYRTLTEWFNRRLLKTVYDEHGRKTTGQRVANDFDALAGDDELLKEEVMDDLRDDGIDPESLMSDMVSWSTMRHHLQTCLDGEKVMERSDSGWEAESVSLAKRVTAEKVSEALSSLSSKGELPGGDEAAIETQVLLSCPMCPTRIPFPDALERGFICRDHLGVAQSS